MAEDINLKIKTEAELKGTDAAKKGLKEVTEEAKKTEAATQGAVNPMALPESMLGPARDEAAEAEEAQRALSEAIDETAASAEQLRIKQAEADVARAKAAKAAREQATAEAAVEQAMGQTAAATSRLKGQLAAMATAELAKGLAAVNPELAGIAASTAQGAAAGGPWGAALGALVGSIGAVKQAYAEYNAVVAETKERIKANDAALQQHAQKAAELKLNKAYETQWDDMLSSVEKVNQAVRDNIELENARRRATETLSQSVMGAEEAAIKAQRQSGSITAAQEDAQMQELRQRRAAAEKQSALDEAQAAQKTRQAALDGAREDLRLIEFRQELALASIEKAEQRWTELNAPGRGATPEELGKGEAAMTTAQKNLETVQALIPDAKKKIDAAQSAVEQGLKLLEVEVTKINKNFDIEAIKQQALDVGEKSQEASKQAADEVKKAIDGIEPRNRLEEENLTALQKAVSDGELSTKEAQAAVQQLSGMSGNLNTELGKILGVVSQFQSEQAARDRVLQNIIAQQSADRLRLQEILNSQSNR